jgi:hypothetical protein
MGIMKGIAYIDDDQIRVIHARYGDPVKDNDPIDFMRSRGFLL